MTETPRATGIEMVAEMDAAATMLRPLRLEILEHLTTPESASGLARRLGLPRQRLNYHLRKLEKAGLLEFVKAERKGNCIERFYRASARHYLISPDALGRVAPRGPAPSPPAAMQDRYSWVHLVALLGKALRDLTTLRPRADRAKQRLTTFSLHTEVRFA